MRLLEFILNLFRKKNPLPEPVPESPTHEPEPLPEPAPPPPPKYLWDTREGARHSVRVICDEEGLTLYEKNLICAIIQAESQFDTKVVRKNWNGTKDVGIIQANSYWYVKKGKFLTEEEALSDPEKCVRLMIKRYRQGFLSDWRAYKNGAYKKYL